MTSRNINLLHLIKSLDLGGIEKSTVLYSNYFCKRLNSVGILASKGFYDKSCFLSKKIERYFPPIDISNKIYFLKNLYFILNIIKENKITHIHYHHRIFIPYIYLLKLIHPEILIIYTHHSCFKDKLNHFICADKIIAINEATKNDLPKRLHKKVTIIPHGIRIKKTQNNISNVHKNIGYVGRFDKSKNLIYLINTFKVINCKIPDSNMILVGNGSMKEELIKEITSLNLVNKIIFQNPSIHDEEIYSKIDILVLPSNDLEGFGIVLLEAMARGIPVIVSNTDSFKELVIDGVNGLIFDKDLDKKIIRLLNDKNLYNEINRNALLKVKDKFNIDNIVSEYLEKIYY